MFTWFIQLVGLFVWFIFFCGIVLILYVAFVFCLCACVSLFLHVLFSFFFVCSFICFFVLRATLLRMGMPTLIYLGLVDSVGSISLIGVCCLIVSSRLVS